MSDDLQYMYWQEKRQNEGVRALVEETTIIFSSLSGKIYMDGNSWCALTGDNLQEGVAGFGKSPRDALDNWWKEFHKPVQ